MKCAHLIRVAVVVLMVSHASVLSAQERSRVGTGEGVYRKWCAPCHDPGIEHPGTHALIAKYGGRVTGALIERRDLDANYVKFVVRHGVSVMPPFRKTEVTDAELTALADWLVKR